MNNLCFYNSQAIYPQNEFISSSKQHTNIQNNQINMIEMINLLSKSQISQQQNLIDKYLAKNQIQQQNISNNSFQFEPFVDLNNNYHTSEMIRKEMEQSQRKSQLPKAHVETATKEYILSQLKEQQRVKHIQQLLKEQQVSSNYNRTNDTIKNAISSKKTINNYNPKLFSQRQINNQSNIWPNQIEILNDGNVKNIPPNLLLDQFGVIGLAMMLRYNDANSNLSMIIGKGEEARCLTQSVQENFEYDSILFDSKSKDSNHLEQMNRSDVYNLSSIKQDLLNVNLVLKNCQEDLLFYLFYFCCISEQQLLAVNLLTSKGWFYNKEFNLWLRQNFQESNSYFIFDVQSWSIKPKSLEELAKMHKSD